MALNRPVIIIMMPAKMLSPTAQPEMPAPCAGATEEELLSECAACRGADISGLLSVVRSSSARIGQADAVVSWISEPHTSAPPVGVKHARKRCVVPDPRPVAVVVRLW